MEKRIFADHVIYEETLRDAWGLLLMNIKVVAGSDPYVVIEKTSHGFFD